MPLTSDRLRELLGTLRFTESLSERSRALLARVGVVRDVAARETIFREGSECRSTYVIEAGHVGLDVSVSGRGVVRLLTLGPGDLLAWSGIVGGARMTASAVALEPTRLVEFSAVELRDLAERDHEFGFAWMRATAEALAKRLTATRLQMLDLFDLPSGGEAPSWRDKR